MRSSRSDVMCWHLMRQSQVSQDAQMAGLKSKASTLVSFAVCLTAVQGDYFVLQGKVTGNPAFP